MSRSKQDSNKKDDYCYYFFHLTLSIRDFYHVKSRDLYAEYYIIISLGNFILN